MVSDFSVDCIVPFPRSFSLLLINPLNLVNVFRCLVDWCFANGGFADSAFEVNWTASVGQALSNIFVFQVDPVRCFTDFLALLVPVYNDSGLLDEFSGFKLQLGWL